MEDYRGLVVRRFTHPEITASDLHFAALNVALSRGATGTSATAGQNDNAERGIDLEGVGGDGGGRVEIPAGHCCHIQDRGADGHLAERSVNNSNQDRNQGEAADETTTVPTAERKRQILQEMEAQRIRLRQRLGKPVTAEALRKAEEILDKYPRNFRPQGKDACNLAVFRIKLKDHTKFHVALPRRTNPIVLADMRRQIEELLEAGAIERCQGQPSSVYAVVMVRKPGQPGKWRLCLDLQPLNANTVPMPYAMPDVHEALDRLSGKKYYSSFDFSAWFQQFDIAEEDREKRVTQGKGGVHHTWRRRHPSSNLPVEEDVFWPAKRGLLVTTAAARGAGKMERV
jgi:hypothetical protein